MLKTRPKNFDQWSINTNEKSKTMIKKLKIFKEKTVLFFISEIRREDLLEQIRQNEKDAKFFQKMV